MAVSEKTRAKGVVLRGTDRARAVRLLRALGEDTVVTKGPWWSDGCVLVNTGQPFRVEGSWRCWDGRSLSPTGAPPRTDAQIEAIIGPRREIARLGTAEGLPDDDSDAPAFTEAQRVWLNDDEYVWVKTKYLRFLEREGQVDGWGWHLHAASPPKRPVPIIVGLRQGEVVGAVMPMQILQTNTRERSYRAVFTAEPVPEGV